MPTDGFAGTNNGVWHRTGSTNSSFVIENLTSSYQTYYWWVWAGCSLTKTSTYSSAKSGTVTLSAAVAAPSCITAQNNLFIFTRGASFEWRNNSSYTVNMTGQQTGDSFLGARYEHGGRGGIEHLVHKELGRSDGRNDLFVLQDNLLRGDVRVV
jgi:hypothetical protein